MAKTAKNLPAVQETQIQFLGWKDPLEKEMVTHSSIACLENSMNRGAWRATVHRVTKTQTQLKPLSRQASIIDEEVYDVINTIYYGGQR